MDVSVREVKMNINSSSSFGTVFFLVVLFIGTGLLAYHAYDLTVENGHLKETNASLQLLKSENDALKAENAKFKADNAVLINNNSGLKSENSSLINENGQLKVTLDNELAENGSLKAIDADKDSELAKLRIENTSLKNENAVLTLKNGKSGENFQIVPSVIQSSIFPSDLERWIKLAILGLAVIFLVEIIVIARAVKHNRLKDKVIVMDDNLTGAPDNKYFHQQNKTRIIDARFNGL